MVLKIFTCNYVYKADLPTGVFKFYEQLWFKFIKIVLYKVRTTHIFPMLEIINQMKKKKAD